MENIENLYCGLIAPRYFLRPKKCISQWQARFLLVPIELGQLKQSKPTVYVKIVIINRSHQENFTVQLQVFTSFVIRFRLTSNIIRKITKLHFGPLYGDIGAIQALRIKILMQRNVVAEFHRQNVSFARKTAC